MVARTQKKLRFKGGRGESFKGVRATPSGRAAPAPRISPPAAAAALRALKKLAAEVNMAWCPMLRQAATEDALWTRVMRAVEKEGTIAQRDVALAVLRHFRGRMILTNESKHPAITESLSRVIRRRAAECPEIKDIGIAPMGFLVHPSFRAWLEDEPAGKLRPTPEPASGEGPEKYWAQWQLGRCAHDGVVLFGRAGDRVRLWRSKRGDRAQEAPPLALAEALVHRDILPTATASRPDQYWLTAQRRYMSVREVARSFGIRDSSPLAAALERVPSPTNAIKWLGKAIHAGVATRLLQHLRSLDILPGHITYGSACSGIDTFAAAVDVVWPGAWEYRHAAEIDAGPRGVLAEAWGLRGLKPDMLFQDATSAQAASAPCVDLFVVSPDCHRFSKRRHGRDADDIAEGAAEAAECLPYVMAGRARVVVIENVDDPDARAVLGTVLTSAPSYVWRSQILSPVEHAGVPVARSRAFFVGVQRLLAHEWV